jgi:hypothetical protein
MKRINMQQAQNALFNSSEVGNLSFTDHQGGVNVNTHPTHGAGSVELGNIKSNDVRYENPYDRGYDRDTGYGNGGGNRQGYGMKISREIVYT